MQLGFKKKVAMQVIQILLCAVTLLIWAATYCSNKAINYNNSGIEKQAKGDLDGAIADYNKAVEIKPDYAVAYYNRGLAYKTKGYADGAIADYTKAIELKPDDALAYRNRGLAKQAKGDLAGASADQTKANQLKPGFFR